MCVIVYLPKDITIEESTLRSCHKQNPHSVGYMFARAGELVLRKFLKLEEFLEAFHADRAANKGTDFSIHFRIATSGKIDIDNCHPFKVTEEIGLMHNGILSCTPGDVSESDTNKFRHQIAPLLKLRATWDNEFFWFMVKETIGSFNKLVFMRKDGAARIVNDKQGTWEEGVWFSNTTWKPYVSAYKGDANGKWWGRNNVNQDATLCECKVRYTYTQDGLCYQCREARDKAKNKVGSALESLIEANDCKYLVYLAPADMIYLKNTKALKPISKSVGVIEDNGVNYLAFKDTTTQLISGIQHNLSSALYARRVSFRALGKKKEVEVVHS